MEMMDRKEIPPFGKRGREIFHGVNIKQTVYNVIIIDDPH
jgi:hypothetical protein